MASYSSCCWVLFFLVMGGLGGCVISSKISLGSRLTASRGEAWFSDNGTFAFGFTTCPGTVNNDDDDDDGDNNDKLFVLAIWFSKLPGDPTLVWSPNRDYPASRNAILELSVTGNLVLSDGHDILWASNTYGTGVKSASMEESGNFILYASSTASRHVWQSFSQPSDTLLPNQPLTASSELRSSSSASHGGLYALKMLQQTTSLSLGLTYILPNSEPYTNYSYWQGPDISNVTSNVTAILDPAGSFGIVYGDSSDGAVYVYKNDNDELGLSYSSHQTIPFNTLRRLTLENHGNLHLYRWDDDVNGSRQWVSEWAAVSNPCDIAGICGNGVCKLDIGKTNASCTCLPGTSQVGGDGLCYENSSLVGKCSSQHEIKNQTQTSEFNISVVQQTNYYFSETSVVANYSDVATVSKCGDACLSDCECVASVYGLTEETPYCWVLRSLDFGGFEDSSATLFVKVRSNGSMTPEGKAEGSSNNSDDEVEAKAVVLPIVLSMALLVALLCLLLYYSVHRKRTLKREMESSLILSGSPMNFSYRDLQIRTCNFSQLLGTGGFGSVYKGSLGDGTLVAVKKLDRVLPHGEKEFIAEVSTIGSMHHMNLVRLCGYCSEGPHREHSQVVTMVRGTRGYLAPEWVSNRPITVKADVYSYGMLLLEIIGGRRNLDMSFDAEDFFYPGWAFKELTDGIAIKAADRRLNGAVDDEELVRALRVAFWCIQDEVFMRPTMGEVVRMLEGSISVNTPPMPQTVTELIEEGLEQVYKAMKREYNPYSSFTLTSHPSSHATCSNSTMSPR
ncbi:hypothetical protein QN277_010526 [Acacia crassicarpa]|uniref:Receptor-like serine/threonine-protein kinase n=1 Tax=Acacia crassicarpa TaxID=499986 RepID=A0AAE1JIN9_9FABA|nr:hypothetical protein QN277_010526 [Acacia crassicarpa]